MLSLTMHSIDSQTATSLSTGAVAGVAVGSIVGISVCCIIAIAIVIYCKKTTNSQNTQTVFSQPALNMTNQIDNQPSAPTPAVDETAIDPPPSYVSVDQGYPYPYQYPGQGYEKKQQQQQYPGQYSNYPQYPPPPHPAANFPTDSEYPQAYGYPGAGELNKYYPSTQEHKF